MSTIVVCVCYLLTGRWTKGEKQKLKKRGSRGPGIIRQARGDPIENFSTGKTGFDLLVDR